MSGWTTIVVLLATVAAGSGAWVVTPKGPNQVLIRSTALLSLTCCYVMWAVVYLAQLHPLIQPTRGDVRILD